MPSLKDQSGYNKVTASKVVKTNSVEELREILAYAAQNNLTVTAAGARHSMGGQSLPAQGHIAVELPQTSVAIHENGTYTVGAGTRWSSVTNALNAKGRSVKIMQSNNDFSVGGTLSVNAHGWPAPYGPFGTSVRKFTIMLADGSVAKCSRDENPELFSHVIGGYGLFGIVLNAQMESVPNCMLQFESGIVSGQGFADRFTKGIFDPIRTTLRMAYGRLSLSQGSFMQESTANFGHEIPAEFLPPPSSPGLAHQFARAVYDWQKGNDFGKAARWFVESRFGPSLQKPQTRNSVLHTPVSLFQNDNPLRTDILHEYFIPPERLGDFLGACRRIIPGAGPDLLNVTLRYLDADDISVMKFAPEPRIAAVMLFNQGISERDDAQMATMTRGLIDAALEYGGSYYLPYRLHAMQDQFESAYPMAADFFAKRKDYDPKGIFANELSRTYG